MKLFKGLFVFCLLILPTFGGVLEEFYDRITPPDQKEALDRRFELIVPYLAYNHSLYPLLKYYAIVLSLGTSLDDQGVAEASSALMEATFALHSDRMGILEIETNIKPTLKIFEEALENYKSLHSPKWDLNLPRIVGDPWGVSINQNFPQGDFWLILDYFQRKEEAKIREKERQEKLDNLQGSIFKFVVSGMGLYLLVSMALEFMGNYVNQTLKERTRNSKDIWYIARKIRDEQASDCAH